ncbi:PaaI family thioesterase [Gordonia sp. HS-NH1]|uniref:PaaI family thioesterase n=1 Tax=Gordonia sp. HS-NH1 TaxID=1435068 RepID=UPI0006E1F063|nr:acyl-CoA thioesterase domain-containing protein [Gordonia sp. HS-NH1]
MNSTSLADESVNGLRLPVFDADNSTAAMGVRLESIHDTYAEFTQRIQDWQRGPDGAISLAAIGPMLDAAVGSGAYLATGGKRNFVMSTLSATFVAGIADRDTVHARSRCVESDRRTDTVASVGEIRGDAGLIAVVTCRAVPVERVLREPAAAAARDASTLGLPLIPAHIEDANGVEFASVLGLDVSQSTGKSLSGIWTTATWMLNPFDTVQGGIVFAVVTEAAHLALAHISNPDESIGLTEISVDLLRSPAAATSYEWTVSYLRIGRRMVNMVVTVTGTDGREQARATCTAFRVRRD